MTTSNGFEVVELGRAAALLDLPVDNVERLLEPLAGVTINEGVVFVDAALLAAVEVMFGEGMAVLPVGDVLRGKRGRLVIGRGPTSPLPRTSRRCATAGAT